MTYNDTKNNIKLIIKYGKKRVKILDHCSNVTQPAMKGKPKKYSGFRSIQTH